MKNIVFYILLNLCSANIFGNCTGNCGNECSQIKYTGHSKYLLDFTASIDQANSGNTNPMRHFHGVNLNLHRNLFSGLYLGMNIGGNDNFSDIYFGPSMYLQFFKVCFLQAKINAIPLIKNAFKKGVTVSKKLYIPDLIAGFNPSFSWTNGVSQQKLGLHFGFNASRYIQNKVSSSLIKKRGIFNIGFSYGWGRKLSQVSKCPVDLGHPCMSSLDIRKIDEFDHIREESENIPTYEQDLDKPSLRLWESGKGIRYIKGAK